MHAAVLRAALLPFLVGIGSSALVAASDESVPRDQTARRHNTYRPSSSLWPHVGPGPSASFWRPYRPGRPIVYVYPPLILPAEELYGPQVLRRLVGVDQADPGFGGSAPRSVRVAQPPNAELRGRVERWLQSGDAQFRQQKYSAALDRYRSAVEAAAQLPEPHVRQAIAHAATGAYEAAARAFRRALRLQGRWTPDDSPFAWMYADELVPKLAHFDALALAVEKSPANEELHLVLGVLLLLDGRPDRAQPFLVRCDELGGNAAGLLDELLDRDPTRDPNRDFRAEAAQPPPAGPPEPAAARREF